MTKKFKSGDKVYHRHLKQFGTFIQYNTLSDEECYVDFIDEDGFYHHSLKEYSWHRAITDGIIAYEMKMGI